MVVDVARHLARSEGFVVQNGAQLVPTARVAPLAPWLASLGVRAAGGHPIGPLLLFAVVGALVPLLLGGLCGSMFGPSVGRVAAWIAAASPVLVMAGGRLGAAVPLVAALLAALAAAASWVKTPRPGRSMGVGLLIGVAALAHPLALALPFVVVLWAWTPLGLTLARGDRARQVTLLLLGFALVVAPWLARNAIRLRSPRLVVLAANDLEGAAPGRRVARLWSPTAAVTGESRAEGDIVVPEGQLPLDTRPVASVLRPLLAVWWALLLPLAALGMALTMMSPRRWFQALPALVLLATVAVAAVARWRDAPALRGAAEAMAILFAAAALEETRRRLRTRARGFRVIEGRRSA